jgi:hypothetical protein
MNTPQNLLATRLRAAANGDVANGIPFSAWFNNQDGASFRLYPKEGTHPAEIALAKAHLFRDRDVVGVIRVSYV